VEVIKMGCITKKIEKAKNELPAWILDEYDPLEYVEAVLKKRAV